MSDKKNVPKIRFPGFTEPWEQRKLEDIYGSIGNAFVGTATPYYVESGHFYLESNNTRMDKSIIIQKFSSMMSFMKSKKINGFILVTWLWFSQVMLVMHP